MISKFIVECCVRIVVRLVYYSVRNDANPTSRVRYDGRFVIVVEMTVDQ